MTDPKLVRFINKGELLLIRLKGLTRAMEARMRLALDRRAAPDRRAEDRGRPAGDRRSGKRRA